MKRDSITAELIAGLQRVISEITVGELAAIQVKRSAKARGYKLSDQDYELIKSTIDLDGIDKIGHLHLESLPDDVDLDISDESLMSILNEIGDEFVQKYPEVTRKTQKIIARWLVKNADQRAAEIAAERVAFEAKLYARWRSAINLYDVYVSILSEFSEDYLHSTRRRKKLPTLRECLIRLNAAAIRSGMQIGALMRAGFADGAYGVWRTAHEIEVIASFLSGSDELIAKRYLDHQLAYQIKETGIVVAHSAKLSGKTPSVTHQRKMERLQKKLCKVYGENFTELYGWAIPVFAKIKPGRKSAPNFSEIERLVGMDHFRAHYARASQIVHALPHALYNHLGLAFSEQHQILLYGPTDFGFARVIENTVIALFNITVHLSNLAPDDDRAYQLQSIKLFAERTISTAIEIEEAIKKETQASERNM